MSPAGPASATTDRYTLALAERAEEVREAQRLRFEVFNLELGEGLATSFLTGLDADAFDDVCDHLLVRERDTGAVVGTYRLQTGRHAASHLGPYSAREFDFAPFEAARDEMVELGRACIAVEHRSFAVLGLLWKGVAHYASSRGARYLIGCSSLTTQDEDAALATYRALAPAHLVEPRWRTSPLPGWGCAGSGREAPALAVPRLLRAYLALGARLCGEPALDREFGTVDFLTWVDLRSMPEAVRRKFLG